jgi:hypothetical protein
VWSWRKRALMRLFHALPILPALLSIAAMTAPASHAGMVPESPSTPVVAPALGGSATTSTTTLWAERVTDRSGSWQGTVEVEQQVSRSRATSAVRVQVWREMCDALGCLDVHSEIDIRMPCALIEATSKQGMNRWEVRLNAPVTTTVSRLGKAGSVTVLERSTTSLPVRIAGRASSSRVVERHRSNVHLSARGRPDTVHSRQASQQAVDVSVTIGSLTWQATSGGLVRARGTIGNDSPTRRPAAP